MGTAKFWTSAVELSFAGINTICSRHSSVYAGQSEWTGKEVVVPVDL
jgi:hypothetical protein